MAAKSHKKKDFPVSNVRRFLEPGPIVLVSSAHEGEKNIMTMGWHMIMEFEPSLVISGTRTTAASWSPRAASA